MAIRQKRIKNRFLETMTLERNWLNYKLSTLCMNENGQRERDSKIMHSRAFCIREGRRGKGRKRISLLRLERSVVWRVTSMQQNDFPIHDRNGTKTNRRGFLFKERQKQFNPVDSKPQSEEQSNSPFLFEISRTNFSQPKFWKRNKS